MVCRVESSGLANRGPSAPGPLASRGALAPGVRLMPIDTVNALVDALKQYRVLEAPQLGQVGKDQARFADPRVLAKDLLQRGWLTSFQINRLFQGRGQDLLLGSYLLLEPLGEGGMGT